MSGKTIIKILLVFILAALSVLYFTGILHLSLESPLRSFDNLVKYGSNDPEKIAMAVKEKGPGAREKAIKVLARMHGDPRGIGLLINALDDGDARVRKAAADGLFGKTTPEAVTRLIELLKDEDARVRGAAARTLGFSKDKRAAGPLLGLLGEGSEEARHLVLVALLQFSIQEDPWILERLTKALESGTPLEKAGAAHVIYEIGTPEPARKALVESLEDKDPRVRANSAKALGKVREDYVISPLLKALDDKEPFVRKEAAGSLVGRKDARLVEQMAVIIKEVQDPAARRSAVSALGDSGDPRAIVPLIAALEDADPEVRVFAIMSLYPFKDDERVLMPVISKLRDADANVRLRAAMSLGLIQDMRASEPLIESLDDDAREVRKAAREALISITGKDYGRDSSDWKEGLAKGGLK